MKDNDFNKIRRAIIESEDSVYEILDVLKERGLITKADYDSETTHVLHVYRPILTALYDAYEATKKLESYR